MILDLDDCPQAEPLYISEYWKYRSYVRAKQIQLFSPKALDHCADVPPPPPVDKPRTPRAVRHPRLREAADLAWQFRQTFYPRGFVKLVRLRVQALLLFKQGYGAEEIAAAMDDAARKGVRRVPKTLLFFIGWIQIRRQRRNHEAAARERLRVLQRAHQHDEAVEARRLARLAGADRQEGEAIGSVLTRVLAMIVPRAGPDLVLVGSGV